MDRGPIGDQTALDDWARSRTDGLIERFPLALDDDLLLVLASVITAAGTWEQPFVETVGRWMGEAFEDGFLVRSRSLDPTVAVLDVGGQRYSQVRVTATNGLEVHLIAGDHWEPPGSVIRAGLAHVVGSAERTAGIDLAVGTVAGCLTATMHPAPTPDPVAVVRLPAFDVTSQHDLLQHDELFGLATARDASDLRGHFSLMTTEPLAIASAVQATRMRFNAESFEAAAVTALGAMAAGMPPAPTGERLEVSVSHDRPFGFLVVEPITKGVAFAGWIGPDRGGSLSDGRSG